MPTIYADSNDGFIYKTNQSSHANARDASSGTASTSTSNINTFLYQVGPARGGGVAYSVRRVFFYFDTSGITSTVASATFNIKRTTGTVTGEMQLVKSNAFGGDGQTALANGDFDAFPGFSAGNTMDGNVTIYNASTIDPALWSSTNSFSSTGIALNSTALSDMVSNDYLIFAIVNSDYDYKNQDGAPAQSLRYPFYTANMSSTSSDPKIDYTLAGYSHTVTGVAAANISTVKGVSSANISTVIGVS